MNEETKLRKCEGAKEKMNQSWKLWLRRSRRGKLRKIKSTFLGVLSMLTGALYVENEEPPGADDLIVDLSEETVEEDDLPPEKDKGEADDLPEIEGMTAEQIQAYAGKKNGELIKMIHDGQDQINKQGNELGLLRKKVTGSAVAKDSAQGKYNVKQKEIVALEKELSGLDKVMNGEKILELETKISGINGEMKDLEGSVLDERVDRQVKLSRNQERATDLSVKLNEEYGLKISPEDWKLIGENAIGNIGDETLARNHLLGELMRNDPKMESLLLAHGGNKAREEIAKASGGVTPGLPGVTVSGMKKVNLSKLNADQRAKVFEGMSSAQIDRFIANNIGD